MTVKVQISMRIDKGLIETVDRIRNGVDRSLIMTKLLQGWVDGKLTIELLDNKGK